MYGHLLALSPRKRLAVVYTFFLSNLHTFSSFSCLVNSAKIPIQSWVRVVKDEIFVSFLSFGEKHSFPIKYDVGSRFFVHAPYQVEKLPLFTWLLRNITRNKYILQMLFVHQSIRSYDNLLYLLIRWITETDFPIVSGSCIPAINPIGHGI